MAEKKVKFEMGVSGYMDMTYEGIWSSFEGSIPEFKKWWSEKDNHVISGPPDLGSCIYSWCKLDGVETPVEEVLKM